jgi:hypothetical protein
MTSLCSTGRLKTSNPNIIPNCLAQSNQSSFRLKSQPSTVHAPIIQKNLAHTVHSRVASTTGAKHPTNSLNTTPRSNTLILTIYRKEWRLVLTGLRVFWDWIDVDSKLGRQHRNSTTLRVRSLITAKKLVFRAFMTWSNSCAGLAAIGTAHVRNLP